MASCVGCESCFEAYAVIFTNIFGCSGQRHCFGLPLLLERSAARSDLVAAFQLTMPDPYAFSPKKLCAF